MRIALISDTHGHLPSTELFEGADLILHAGDIGPHYNVQEWQVTTFAPWLHQLRQKMDIPFWGTLGNHDFGKNWGLDLDFPIIVDDVVLARGMKIWFSPWSPRFGNWAWMREEPELTEFYSQIPVDVDIVVSHSPMFGALDANIDGTLCGSKALRVRLREIARTRDISQRPLLVCGHIHEAKGYLDAEFADVYNVSCLDESYQMRPDPITWIEL